MAFNPLPTEFISGADRIYVLGSQLTVEMRDALTQASFDTSIDQVSQLQMTFADPNFKILGTGALTTGIRIDFEDYRLEIASIETEDVNGTEGFSIKARSMAVRTEKQQTGPLVVTNMSPSEFVANSCAAAGILSVVQPSPRRPQIARDLPEPGQTYSDQPSNWTTFQRLADELGFICFEAADVVYFGQPSWLIANVPNEIVANYQTGDEKYLTVGIPRCNKSMDSKATTVEVELPTNWASYARPGKRLTLGGVPLFNGQYLVTSVDVDLLDPAANVSVSAQTPIDPEPHPPETATAANGTARANTKSSQDFVAWAVKQIGDRYVYGAAVSSSTDPTQFDCSSLVKWALQMVGITDCPRVSEAQISWAVTKGREISVSQGINTRGALLWHMGHVAISLGNGKTVEAANSRVGVISGNAGGGRFARAALIPGLRY